MSDDTTPKATLLGKLVMLLILGGCAFLAWRFFIAKPATPPAPGTGSGPAAPAPRSGSSVRIAVAYGTEKERWLKWAVAEFAKAEQARAEHAARQVAVRSLKIARSSSVLHRCLSSASSNTPDAMGLPP